MAVVKLKAGETVIVAAVGADLKPDNTLPTPPATADDPWYGIDLVLAICAPPTRSPAAVNRLAGLQHDGHRLGRPDHTLPPPPIDPAGN
jgi:hypothetical protein